ncbi:MAG: class A beta-lactamase-related serine hydrolase [Fibrobacter sp.]|nr:class A beta-lactamase-related serine hydrolase [Fibrobacter sp.]
MNSKFFTRTFSFIASIAIAASFACAGESYGYFAKSAQSAPSKAAQFTTPAQSSSVNKTAQSTQESAGLNESQHFPMHSVMKFPQALYVAHFLDSTKISIDAKVQVVKATLMQNTWSPMMKEMGDTAMVSYAELLQWSLVQSDNNASDLLFKFCGAPGKITRYIAKLGFKDIQIGATEAEMHADLAKSDLNWCTPKGMANLFEWFYKNKDKTANLKFVWKTMSEVETGKDRIPAAAPAGATVVHKTGTGFPPKDKLPPMNDAGIVILPSGQVQFIAVFVPEPTAPNQLADIASKALSVLRTK